MHHSLFYVGIISMNYTDLDIESQPDRTIVRRDCLYICSIKAGWRAYFFGKQILLTHPEHPPRRAWIESVNVGDVLPRPDDEFA